MKWIKKNLITGVLLIAAIIPVVAHFRQDSEIRRLQTERFQQLENELQTRLEQTTRQLERSEILRSIDRRASDSLSAVILDNTAKLRQKDRQIANLKGKYDYVPVDSLGATMDRRAENADR